MPSRLDNVDDAALLKAVRNLFREGRHDPAVTEILAEHFQSNDACDDATIEAMRGRLASLRGWLNEGNYKTVVISTEYYSPMFRDSFTPSPGDVFPPSYRDQPPTNDDEAQKCLPGAHGRSEGLLWITSPATSLIYKNAVARDLNRAAGHLRNSNERLLDDYSSGALTEVDAARLIENFDIRATIESDKQKQLAALRTVPKQIGEAAE